MIRTRASLGLASLAGLFLFAGCNNSNGSVANVSGDSLTRDEFIDQLQTKETVRVVANNGQVVEAQVADTLAFQAMQDLVTRKIVMQLAKDEGLAPTEKEVDAEIDFRTKIDSGFIKEKQAKGYTLQGIRQNVLSELAQERLVTKGITVTEAEVDKYIKENPKQFREPAKVDLTWIFAKTLEKRDAAQKALDTGMLFKLAARSYSDAPNASATDGKFPVSNLDSLAPELRAKLEKTETGKSTDWIQAQEGYAKFFINSKMDPKPIEITKERKELLRRRMAIDQGSKASDLTKRVQDKLKNAKIEVQDAALKDMWKRFEDKLKASAKDAKLPETTTGGTGGTTPAPEGSTPATTAGQPAPPATTTGQ